jgi:hypothetical protein
VIYWDDGGSAVSGDVYSTEMSRADLVTVWKAHVS